MSDVPDETSAGQPPADPEKAGARRWLKRAALAALVLLIGVALVVFYLVGTDSGRGVVLDEVATRIEQASGWRIDVADSAVALEGGRLRLELSDVRAGVAGADPYLRAEEVSALVEWRPLLRREYILPELRLTAPRLDLAAPRPEGDEPEQPEEPKSFDLPLEIADFSIEDGAVVGGPGRGWLESFALEALDADGSLGDGAVEVQVADGRVVLERAEDGVRLPIEIDGRLRGPVLGPWTIDALELDGEALDARLAGTVGAAGQPTTLDFSGRLDPALLVPKIARGRGEATVEGRIALPAGDLVLDARTEDFPVAVLEPFLPESVMAGFGTLDRFDLDADLDANAKALEDTRGRFDLVAKRGEAVVVRGEATVGAAESAGETELVLDADLRLLPGEPGVASLRGRLYAGGWDRFAEGRLEDVRVVLEKPRLEPFAERLLEIWPAAEGALARLPEGALELELTGSGPVTDPAGDLTLDLRPSTGGALALDAEVSRRRVEAELDLEAIDPGRLGLGLELPVAGEWSGAVTFGGASPRELRAELRSPRVVFDTADEGAEGERAVDGADPDGADPDGADPDGADPDGAAAAPADPVAEDVAADAVPGDADTVAEGPADGVAQPAATEPVGGDLVVADVALDLRLEVPWAPEITGGPRLARPATGRLELRADRLDGAGLSARRVEAEVAIDGPLDPAALPALLLDGLELQARAAEVRAGELALASLDVDLASRDGAVELRRFDGLLLPPPAVDIDQLPFTGTGDVRFAERRLSLAALERAEVRLEAGDAGRGVAAVIEAGLGDGRLSLQIPRLRLDGALASGSLRAEIPLRAARALRGQVPGLDDQLLADLGGGPAPAGEAGEPIVLTFDLASLDLGGFERWTGGDLPAATGDLRGTLRFDPRDPAAAVGQVVVDSGRLDLPRGLVETDGPLTLRLEDRRVDLQPATLRLDEQVIDAGGRLTLAPGWRPGDPPGELVASFDAEAAGALDVALVEDFVPDARMEGVVSFSASAAGDLDSFRADISLSGGEDVSLTFDRPYVTRLAAPDVELRFEDGQLFVESAEAQLNEGSIQVSGRVGEEIDIAGELEDVRYRLDYGLTLLVGGDFSYTNTPRPGKLQADLVVERGTLRRRIDAGQELLDVLLSPPSLETGDGSSPFGDTELDLRVSTEDGVRVKNNLADLKVGWAPIRVEGTVSQPRIMGRLEVEPDGRVYAYGQVIRLDRAAVVWNGAPAAPPRLDLQMTTSLEDPSLLTPEDQRVLASLAGGSDDDFSTLDDAERSARVRENVASGLTTYFGDRLASRLGRALGRTELRYRPLWIFGEADPEARLVLSRDVSTFVSVGVAFDLRQADEQFYLLEVGRLPRLPRLTGTVFSNDQGQFGATFQQRLIFGGGADEEEDGRPQVRNIEIVCPRCSDRGRGSAFAVAQRALSSREGRPIDPTTTFDLEVEVAERLRRSGYPDPRVLIDLEPLGEESVELEATLRIRASLEPGPRAEFVFVGEKPPRARRDQLRDLYRSDYSELASLGEIEQTAERIWRSLGYPWPEVRVEVERLDEPLPDGTRQVTIHSAPGEEYDLEPPRFAGVPADVEAELQGRFLSQQSRAELVAGEGPANERLLDALTALGYPRAAVADRSFEPETAVASLTLDAGPRRVLEEIEVSGAPAGEEQHLRQVIGLEPGSPLVGAELAASAFAVEQDLRQRGWIDARVRLEVPPPPLPDAPLDGAGWRVDARFEIEPGLRQTLTGVEIDGIEVTRRRWVERLSGVEKKRGQLLDATQVAEARRRLLETRLFDRVQVDVETNEAGEAVLRLDLSERPRYQASYGLRWEESDGFGALFDVLDRNASGRGVGLGLRALWIPQERAVRLYSQFPRLFNSPLELELFVEGFDEEEEGLLSEGFELSAQLKWPLAARSEVRAYLRFRSADVFDERELDPEERTEEVPLLGFQIFYDRRDDPFDPRGGYFASADLSGSEEVVSGDDSYVRLFTQFDHYWPLGERFTLAQGVRVGYSDVFSGEMPRDVRFFAGGARSLRGYPNRSVGPREPTEDGDDRAAGGQATLILHEELRYELSAALQAVLFVDAGNVWALSEDFGDELLTGVGLGVRYRSPVGMLRLDLAHPLDRRDGDEEIEVYVGLGHAF